MGKRLELHEELCGLLHSRNAYFQPPPNIRMSYPAIRYKISGIDKAAANDRAYRLVNRYEVTYIDANPDSTVPAMILEYFPMCSFDRWYTADNLNHWVITLYY
jgi:hypothetical protein